MFRLYSWHLNSPGSFYPPSCLFQPKQAVIFCHKTLKAYCAQYPLSAEWNWHWWLLSMNHDAVWFLTQKGLGNLVLLHWSVKLKNVCLLPAGQTNQTQAPTISMSRTTQNIYWPGAVHCGCCRGFFFFVCSSSLFSQASNSEIFWDHLSSNWWTNTVLVSGDSRVYNLMKCHVITSMITLLLGHRFEILWDSFLWQQPDFTVSQFL